MVCKIEKLTVIFTIVHVIITTLYMETSIHNAQVDNMNDIQWDILYSITKHLTHETCVAFLLSCKNNAKLLQKQYTRKILCGEDVINVSSSIYKKRIAEYIVWKAYNKRKRCIERAVRAVRFCNPSEEYSENAEVMAKSSGWQLGPEFYSEATLLGACGEYMCIDAFECTRVTASMFHNTKDIDKELACCRYPPENEIYESDE